MCPFFFGALFTRRFLHHLLEVSEILDEQGAALLLEDAQACQTIQLARDGLEVRAHAARELGMCRRGIDALLAAVPRGEVGEAQDLGLDSASALNS